MRQSYIRIGAAESATTALDRQGYSCIYVAVDGDLAGLVPYADKIRPESRVVIHRLHAIGIRNSIMLTGDNAIVARSVGASACRVKRCCRPTRPKSFASSGATATSSLWLDGINDSPALSFADVGIAIKHGAEVARESADVVLMEDSLWKLVKAVEISRGAVGLIRENYAIVAGRLALPGGLITPEITALISNGSAILASLNGIRPILR